LDWKWGDTIETIDYRDYATIRTITINTEFMTNYVYEVLTKAHFNFDSRLLSYGVFKFRIN